MDIGDNSLGSAATMAEGNAAVQFMPYDEPSLGSAPTLPGGAGRRPNRPAPGDDLLGRYTVLEELGQGGMGVVYKCLDREGGIEVAIKCLPPEVTRIRDELEEIRENYQIVARLHHSSISGLRYLERDSASGDYYVVMDLAEGEDLSRILRRRRGRPMPLHEALDILRPVAAALDYAHGEGVLHRDVKPANVKVEALGWESRAETQRRRDAEKVGRALRASRAKRAVEAGL
ncbi:MAG: protein kinase [Kiritimatiellae bacterium]|nr:protein kinase [Kiritimatiellia bacterium]